MSNSRLRVRQLPEDVVGKPNDGYLCQFNGSEIDCCVLPRNLCCEPGGIEEFSLSYHFSHGAFPATVVCGKLTSWLAIGWVVIAGVLFSTSLCSTYGYVYIIVGTSHVSIRKVRMSVHKKGAGTVSRAPGIYIGSRFFAVFLFHVTPVCLGIRGGSWHRTLVWHHRQGHHGVLGQKSNSKGYQCSDYQRHMCFATILPTYSLEEAKVKRTGADWKPGLPTSGKEVQVLVTTRTQMKVRSRAWGSQLVDL